MTNENCNEKLRGNSWRDYIRWEWTNYTILNINPKLGDQIRLLTIWGYFTFSVVDITDTEVLLETDDLNTTLKKNDDGKWQYNHWVRDKHAKLVLPIVYRKEIHEQV